MALSIGSTGSNVGDLQRRLTALGFDPKGVDNQFGKNTQAALAAYQRSKGISPTGKATTATMRSLQQDSFTPSRSPAGAAPRAPAAAAARSPSGAPAASAVTGPSSSGPSMHVNTPWYSQFDPAVAARNGYTAGGASCKPTAKAMARAAGANPTEQTVSGRGMSSYIDSQLAAGKPVLGTVHHSGTHSGNHVLAITGKGTDAQGRTYYTFNDPGTTHPEMGRDTNPNNRLYLNPQTGALTRAGTNNSGPVYQQDYQLQFVRKNA
jgi:peptidoglycan hydrolase-like protein with peptidoglycan-binding domain